MFSGKFGVRYESVKSKIGLILLVYNLMIGRSKKNRKNYQRKCFSTKEKETGIKR